MLAVCEDATCTPGRNWVAECGLDLAGSGKACGGLLSAVGFLEILEVSWMTERLLASEQAFDLWR
jgi:hypothetical protein